MKTILFAFLFISIQAFSQKPKMSAIIELNGIFVKDYTAPEVDAGFIISKNVSGIGLSVGGLKLKDVTMGIPITLRGVIAVKNLMFNLTAGYLSLNDTNKQLTGGLYMKFGAGVVFKKLPSPYITFNFIAFQLNQTHKEGNFETGGNIGIGFRF